jgi:hypothetical protein
MTHQQTNRRQPPGPRLTVLDGSTLVQPWLGEDGRTPTTVQDTDGGDG